MIANVRLRVDPFGFDCIVCAACESMAHVLVNAGLQVVDRAFPLLGPKDNALDA
jgi:hypothetical protein